MKKERHAFLSMLNRITAPFLVLLFLLPGHFIFAQGPFKGYVKDKDGRPVAGATIGVKGKRINALSGEDGAFAINAGTGETLVVSSVGFDSYELKLGANTNGLNIQLTTNANVLSDVVVVGYGTQKKKDLTGSVSSININDTKKYSASDLSQLLQGRAAGVSVNSDGQPGAVPNVRIRGFSTFGGAEPFYVVDGVPGTTIRDFSPNDIETMTVLKDASAAAIYGAAAANGVIIITTRQGKKNTALKLNYNGYYGYDKVWQRQDVTDRVQYQTLNNESRVNAGKPLFPANDPSNPGYVKINTDWQKEGLKTGNRQNHNIGLSGGGANNTYNLSLDYFDNKGTYVGNGPDYKRYIARINTTAEKGILKVGEFFNYTHSHENSLTFRDDILLGGIPPLIGTLVVAIPTMPVYDPANLNGFGGSSSEFNGANSLNGIGINSILRNYTDVDRTFANVYAELHLLNNNGHNIRFKTSLSYDKTNARDFIWQPAFYLGKFFSSTIARLNDNSRVYTKAAIENTLNYDKTFAGKHAVEVLVGQSYRYGDALLRESRGEGFTTPYYPVVSNGQTRSAKGSEFINSLSSYFGRINYSFNDRYLLSASLRRDGSSRFSPSNKFGYFPAASVGWKLSNESFWKVSPSIVSSLKLRASYGKLGNQEIADYQFQGIINSGVPYTFNGVNYLGGIQTQVASPNIQWESKAITNAGFDAILLNGHFDLSAEYYMAKSTNLLVQFPIPASTGFENLSPVANLGAVNNSGVEITAGYHKTKGLFKFDVSANLSTVKNKVIELGGSNNPVYGVGSRTVINREIGEHYGFVYEGLFQTQAEITAHAKQFGATLAPGDVKYKDISGPNGKPDGVVDEAYDRVPLGSGIPKFNYGFSFTASYKRFDASVFASGSGKFLINSRMYRDLHHSAGSLNYSTDMLNRWTPTNTHTDIPRLNDDDVNNFKDSNRPGWLQNGTYLRINTVSIGYTFRENIIKGLASARLYATVQNLYSFQHYQQYNPDFTSGVFNPGFDFGSYPKPRTIMVGVQVSF